MTRKLFLPPRKMSPMRLFTMLVGTLVLRVAPPGIAWQNTLQDDSSIFKKRFNVFQWSWNVLNSCQGLPPSGVGCLWRSGWLDETKKWPFRDWWERCCMTSEPYGLSSVARPRVAQLSAHGLRGWHTTCIDVPVTCIELFTRYYQVLPAPTSIILETCLFMPEMTQWLQACVGLKSMGPRLRPEREQDAEVLKQFHRCGSWYI